MTDSKEFTKKKKNVSNSKELGGKKKNVSNSKLLDNSTEYLTPIQEFEKKFPERCCAFIDQNQECKYLRCLKDDQKIKHIFINNVDCYQTKAICRNIVRYLQKDKYILYGSLSKNVDMKQVDQINVIKQYVNEIIYRNQFDYYEHILKCDYIIYDIGYDVNQITEVDLITKKYMKTQYGRDFIIGEKLCQKYFILISSPLCWATTRPIKCEYLFYETDYRRRRPHRNYIRHQCIERQIMALQKSSHQYFRTIVVCPGFTYGGANDIFHYIFYTAFYNKNLIPIPEPGTQYLPLIYIRDFACMIRHLIEEFPDPKVRYIFAVEPKPVKFKYFVRMIASTLARNPMKVRIMPFKAIYELENELVTNQVMDVISTNLKMIPEYFKNFPFKFPQLLPVNFQLGLEYRHKRNMVPIKALIVGPPFIGKTKMAKMLAKNYKLNYLAPRDCIPAVVQKLDILVPEARKYLERLKVEKEVLENSPFKYTIEDKAHDDQVCSLINDKLQIWESDLKALKDFLNSKECQCEGDFWTFEKKCLLNLLSSIEYNENQGYVLDDFPYDYYKTKEIFGIEPHKESSSEMSSTSGSYNADPTETQKLITDTIAREFAKGNPKTDNTTNESVDDDDNKTEENTPESSACNENCEEPELIAYNPIKKLGPIISRESILDPQLINDATKNINFNIDSLKVFLLDGSNELLFKHAIARNLSGKTKILPQCKVEKIVDNYRKLYGKETTLLEYFEDILIEPYRICVNEFTNIDTIFNAIVAYLGDHDVAKPLRISAKKAVSSSGESEDFNVEPNLTQPLLPDGSEGSSGIALPQCFLDSEEHIKHINSLNLKEYLIEHVVPILNKAFLKLSEDMPEMPIEYLLNEFKNNGKKF